MRRCACRLCLCWPARSALAGYQTYAVGKLHVYPQRDRIGFDDVLLNEDGRHHLGLGADDYELFLACGGLCRPGVDAWRREPMITWCGPGICRSTLHPTNWEAYEMCRAIRRRDPTRPAFWYLSFNRPHPPLTPPACYLDMYRDVDIPLAPGGEVG